MYSDEIDLFQAYATHKTPTSLSIKLVMHKKIANINKILEEALYCPNEVKLSLKKEVNELKSFNSWFPHQEIDCLYKIGSKLDSKIELIKKNCEKSKFTPPGCFRHPEKGAKVTDIH